MEKIQKIFILFITCIMLAAPAMAYTSIMVLPDKKEVGCCAEKLDEHHSENSHDSKSCKDEKHCGDNCPTHDCCVHMNVLKNFVQNSNPKLNSVSFPLEQIKNEHYLSFYFKDISYSFWHPPKYVS
ncbi:hypothetical protein [Moheibacter sediminis]|uniref:Transmembrane protein n=1 Tax=Moheibacter sediminis TaxID=1434700 RepID=A0A1W1ZL36_9FLAO|nr:hypothetical protein [Moheibacter sediminis]SMC48922.1 hypothetical protein SAMN06296427_10329 [Moheibacter sediminis]